MIATDSLLVPPALLGTCPSSAFSWCCLAYHPPPGLRGTRVIKDSGNVQPPLHYRLVVHYTSFWAFLFASPLVIFDDAAAHAHASSNLLPNFSSHCLWSLSLLGERWGYMVGSFRPPTAALLFTDSVVDGSCFCAFDRGCSASYPFSPGLMLVCCFAGVYGFRVAYFA